jgi:hypothetical protein
MHEYLGLESGLPIFKQDFTCPALLDMSIIAACTGLSPAMVSLSRLFQFTQIDRLIRVRSPLLTESLLISFPAGT